MRGLGDKQRKRVSFSTEGIENKCLMHTSLSEKLSCQASFFPSIELASSVIDWFSSFRMRSRLVSSDE